MHKFETAMVLVMSCKDQYFINYKFYVFSMKSLDGGIEIGVHIEARKCIAYLEYLFSCT